MQFDSHFIEYAEIDYGDYLPNGSFFGEPQIIDIDPEGSLKAILFAATSRTSTSNGNGILATLRFNSLQGVESDLILLNETVLSNKAGEPSFPHLENSKTYPTGVSDLAVESVQAFLKNTTEARHSYSKGDEFQLRATVRNRGNVPSTAKKLIFYGPAAKDTEKGNRLGEINIASLNPNRAVEVSLSDFVPAPEGPNTHYYYTACIDRFKDAVTDNNCNTLKITIDPPDLEVTGMWVEKPTTVVPGGKFNLTVIVRNLGRTSDKTALWWYYHGERKRRQS